LIKKLLIPFLFDNITETEFVILVVDILIVVVVQEVTTYMLRECLVCPVIVYL